MHIFYINLDSATDRRDYIEKQCADIGLSAERLSATTPADLTDDFTAAHCDRPGRWVTVSPAELACTVSHRRAWTEIVERSLPMALVLEDDVYFSPRLKEFLEALEPLCEGMDVVRIETQSVATRVGPVAASSGGITLHSLHTALWGCGGYVVTQQGARKLIGPLTRYDIPVDYVVFDYHFGTSRQLETRVSIPAGVANGAAAIALQGDRFESSLDGARSERHNRLMAERGERKIPETLREWESALLARKERWRRQINRTFRKIEETRIPLY